MKKGTLGETTKLGGRRRRRRAPAAAITLAPMEKSKAGFMWQSDTILVSSGTEEFLGDSTELAANWRPHVVRTRQYGKSKCKVAAKNKKILSKDPDKSSIVALIARGSDKIGKERKNSGCLLSLIHDIR